MGKPSRANLTHQSGERGIKHMIYDTAGNQILEPIQTCNCGFTSGCSNFRPAFIGSITDGEAEDMRKRLIEWKKRFDEDFKEKIEELKRI